MLKKVLALLLTVAMCLSVFAACKKDSDKKDYGSDATGSVELGGNWEKPLFEETVKIEIHMPANDNYVIEGTYLDTLLSINENVDVTWTVMNSFQEQFALMAADHDLPEITWSNSTMQYKTYGPAGAFVDINKYLDRMPNLKAVLEKYPEAKEAYTDRESGEMWAIPCLEEYTTDPYAFIYREDVFQKLNLEWPTTQDGFYNVLKALKQEYPNSYPFVLRQMTSNMNGLVFWLPCWGSSMIQMGKANLFTQNADGTASYDPINQGMKECLTFLNKLYKEGLLHESVMTLTNNEWVTAFASEQSFVGWDKMDRIAIQLQPAGENAGIDGFRLVGGAPIAFGTNGVAAITKNGVYGTYCFMISSAVEKDANRLSQILAFMDWLYSEEGIITTNWGGEGQTWERDENGNIKYTEALLAEDDPQLSRGMGVGSTYGVKLKDAYVGWLDETDLKSLELANKYATLEGHPDLNGLYTEDEQLIWDTYSTALFNNTHNGIQSFIIGAGGFDINKDWDNWVSRITGPKFNYAQLKQIHEAAYKRLEN